MAMRDATREYGAPSDPPGSPRLGVACYWLGPRVYSTHAHQALLKLTKLSHLGQPNCTIATSRTVSSSGHTAEPCKRSHIVESLVAGLASWLLRA